MFVEIVEFTRRVVRLGLEEDLRELQNRLEADPRAGDLDPGTCGLRTVRMTDAAHGQGKRGGARVHYLFVPSPQIIYLVNLYPKREQTALTPDQERMLCRLARLIATE
ncbi:MAG: addiction module toxin RelE [Gemmatimonadetes bacterium]|nr:addiction module toxin RelE [Gemmatimonadota bacterium]